MGHAKMLKRIATTLILCQLLSLAHALCGIPVLSKYVYHEDWLEAGKEKPTDYVENSTLTYRCVGEGVSYQLTCHHNEWLGVWPRCGPPLNPSPAVVSLTIQDLNETSPDFGQVVYKENQESEPGPDYSYKRRKGIGLSPLSGRQKWTLKLDRPVDPRLIRFKLRQMEKGFLKADLWDLAPDLLHDAEKFLKAKVDVGPQYNCSTYYIHGMGSSASHYGLQTICDERLPEEQNMNEESSNVIYDTPIKKYYNSSSVLSDTINLWFEDQYDRKVELQYMTIYQVDCPPPIIPVGRRLRNGRGGGGKIGERRELTCQSGFEHLDDPSASPASEFLICDSISLTWVTDGLLNCVPTNACSPFPEPLELNDTQLIISRKVFHYESGERRPMNGSRIEFSCRDQGTRFNLTGPPLAECVNGNWTTTDWPHCDKLIIEVVDHFSPMPGNLLSITDKYAAIIFVILAIAMIIMAAAVVFLLRSRHLHKKLQLQKSSKHDAENKGQNGVEPRYLIDGKGTYVHNEREQRYINEKFLPRGGGTQAMYDDTGSTEDGSVYQDVEGLIEPDYYESGYDYATVEGDANNNGSVDMKKAGKSSTIVDMLQDTKYSPSRDSAGYEAPIQPAKNKVAAGSGKPRITSAYSYILSGDIQSRPLAVQQDKREIVQNTPKVHDHSLKTLESQDSGCYDDTCQTPNNLDLNCNKTIRNDVFLEEEEYDDTSNMMIDEDLGRDKNRFGMLVIDPNDAIDKPQPGTTTSDYYEIRNSINDCQDYDDVGGEPHSQV